MSLAVTPPGDTALICSSVDALAMRATGVLRPRVFIETCKYAAHEPHYQKTWARVGKPVDVEFEAGLGKRVPVFVILFLRGKEVLFK